MSGEALLPAFRPGTQEELAATPELPEVSGGVPSGKNPRPATGCRIGGFSFSFAVWLVKTVLVDPMLGDWRIHHP